MTNYTWTILELGVDNKIVSGHDDMVSIVYWTCTATEDIGGQTYVAMLSRNTVIPYHSDHPYILYADLTETECLDWVFEQGTVKTDTEAELQQMINAQATPEIITPPLPWAN